MEPEDKNVMELSRTGEIFSAEPGVVGNRGLLTIGKESFFTIERGGRYVTLPLGTFECTMEANSSKGDCFRVAADGAMGHHVATQAGGWAGILIHSANYPKELLGCIAPGMTKQSDGVGQSRDALKKIFLLLGGFQVGAKHTLKVIS
jgi:hypothetical protein